jgi:hypothetical protein
VRAARNTGLVELFAIIAIVNVVPFAFGVAAAVCVSAFFSEPPPPHAATIASAHNINADRVIRFFMSGPRLKARIPPSSYPSERVPSRAIVCIVMTALANGKT